MSLGEALRTWAWIPPYWATIYFALRVSGRVLEITVVPSCCGLVHFVGIPLLVVPLTYGKLVGGGCSLRFGVCAVVKGMLVGIVFLTLSVMMDIVVAIYLSSINCNSLLDLATSALVHQVWLLSAIVGGMAARVAEVRGGGQSRTWSLTVVRPDESD
ncbi:MAG: hypothetical protein HXY34_02630 [Candidatus Thorarchaeota archaeon]|nr:hypothetical protein [Candidatus Thorarchaeota archaeon]